MADDDRDDIPDYLTGDDTLCRGSDPEELIRAGVESCEGHGAARVNSMPGTADYSNGLSDPPPGGNDAAGLTPHDYAADALRRHGVDVVALTPAEPPRLGVRCGRGSGNLEALVFKDDATAERWLTLVGQQRSGLAERFQIVHHADGRPMVLYQCFSAFISASRMALAEGLAELLGEDEMAALADPPPIIATIAGATADERGLLLDTARYLAVEGVSVQSHPGANGKAHAEGSSPQQAADASEPSEGGAPAAGASEGGQERNPLEADDDPHRLARLYLNDHRGTDGLRLRYWREEWHRWDGAAYRAIPDKEVKAELCGRIKAEYDRLAEEDYQNWQAKGGTEKQPVARKVTTSLTANVEQALRSMTVLPAALNSPAWLEGASALPTFPAGEMLACRNGLLHLPSFADGREQYMIPPTPRFFSPNALDYDFDPRASVPAQWLAFLSKTWPDDPEAISTLQEWFGYSLLPDTKQQKVLMIVGPKRSGKGTIARVLRAMVGPANVGAPTLAGLGTNFGLQPLLSKTLAVISDARLSGRSDVAIVVERLLSISGEDLQTIDRKNLPHVDAQLAVRFVVLTNELPRLNDASGAIVSRLVVLRQTQTWYGQEDTGLTDRLLTELPGILRWAIDGWKRLRDRGHFVQPASGLELVRDMEDLSSPVGAFLRDCCEQGPAYEVEVEELYGAWQRWCEENGRKEHGTKQSFGRDLGAVVATLNVRQHRQEDGRARYYVGLRLRADC